MLLNSWPDGSKLFWTIFSPTSAFTTAAMSSMSMPFQLPISIVAVPCLFIEVSLIPGLDLFLLLFDD